jgi:thiamine biosynthesis lipoprotein
MESFDLQHMGMSTLMTHRAYGEHAEEALRAVRGEAERLESLMSRFIAESDIGRLNGSAGVRKEALSEETCAVLARAAALSGRSGGLFDVTIGPLVDLWRGGRDAGEPPSEECIRRALALVGYDGIELYPQESAAMLMRPGMSVDLGGIGKGYAADRFLGVFQEYGVESAFTNIGGNVAALGGKPGGAPWRVGIQHPRREGALIGAVSVAGRSVVTSGDYQRFFTGRDGRRYHHILDPRTGRPAESGLVSATVVAGSSMDADALSTAVFAAGRERGSGLLKGFAGAEAVLIDRDLRVYVTEGLKDSFQPAEGISAEVLK